MGTRAPFPNPDCRAEVSRPAPEGSDGCRGLREGCPGSASRRTWPEDAGRHGSGRRCPGRSWSRAESPQAVRWGRRRSARTARGSVARPEPRLEPLLPAQELYHTHFAKDARLRFCSRHAAVCEFVLLTAKGPSGTRRLPAHLSAAPFAALTASPPRPGSRTARFPLPRSRGGTRAGHGRQCRSDAGGRNQAPFAPISATSPANPPKSDGCSEASGTEV